MHYRDYLQQLIYKIINPVVKGLIKMGITPNIITTTGLILNIAAAAVFIYAGYLAKSEAYFYVGLGGGVVLFAGLFDMLDGRVARLGNMVSRFGASCLPFSEYSFSLSCKGIWRGLSSRLLPLSGLSW